MTEKIYTTEIAVTAEQVESIILNALESQSTYWCRIDNTGPEWDKKPIEMTDSQFAVQRIMNGDGVTLCNIEGKKKAWKVNLQMVLEGIGLAITNGYEFADYTDCVLQYALFGKLVYE